MKIRADQMHVFAGEKEQSFFRETAALLRRRHAAALAQCKIADDRVEGFVRESVAAAQQYALVNEADLRLFCELRLLFGLKLDRDPAVRDVLKRTDIDGETKMNLLDEMLVFERETPI